MRDFTQQSPLHGDRGLGDSRPVVIGGPIVAISPEPGSRGAALAKAISRRLQWPLYDPDALGYLIGQPGQADEIMDRLNEISFNSSLMREMRAISFVTDLIDASGVPTAGPTIPPRKRWPVWSWPFHAPAERCFWGVGLVLSCPDLRCFTLES